MSQKTTNRKTKQPPRTFECFPEDASCPVCHTNDDGECVLVPIVGTQEGGICQAKPIHLVCAIISYWYEDKAMGVAIG